VQVWLVPYSQKPIHTGVSEDTSWRRCVGARLINHHDRGRIGKYTAASENLLLLITFVDLDAPQTVHANLVCDAIAESSTEETRSAPLLSPSGAPDTAINKCTAVLPGNSKNTLKCNIGDLNFTERLAGADLCVIVLSNSVIKIWVPERTFSYTTPVSKHLHGYMGS